MIKLNKLIRKHTAFDGILDLLRSTKRNGYVPSLATSANDDGEELTIIADAFDDLAKRLSHPHKRAFRW